MKTCVILIGICLLAGAVFGADTVESFVRQSLDIDLETVPFGTTAGTNYTHTDAPVSPPPLAGTNVSWTTDIASELYHRRFPNRTLRFGFRNGRLETVRISISAFDGSNVVNTFGDGEKMFERRRNELRQILDEIIRIRSNPEFDSQRKGAGFDIRYGAMCAPTPESLYLLEIEITASAAQGNAATIKPGKTASFDRFTVTLAVVKTPNDILTQHGLSLHTNGYYFDSVEAKDRCVAYIFAHTNEFSFTTTTGECRLVAETGHETNIRLIPDPKREKADYEKYGMMTVSFEAGFVIGDEDAQGYVECDSPCACFVHLKRPYGNSTDHGMSGLGVSGLISIGKPAIAPLFDTGESTLWEIVELNRDKRQP